MQTLEKIAHAPMPFTSGGQTITDRINAAKHSLAGSQLGKTICKATTEELMAPKKKHLDYLLHCTNEPNVSIPSMANLLIERTQNPNWVVVYKALITIHNLMCYGNERFSQYLASCNTTFNLTNFVDKSSLANGAIAAGYDMSTHVRRYGKYISEKIHTYRLCAFDFCKVKRGRDDGLLRTLHTDKLLKTMPILQTQIDALLEFQVTSSELNNGVINCSFILLFRDLIRLFACYNDGVINLLEKYFDMNKKQCREALDLYKGFLSRLDRVSAFLSIAESVGIERGEVPDLTRAPASLLEALESHLYHLEGGRGPPPVSSAQQIVNQQIYTAQQQVSIYQQQQQQMMHQGGGYGGGGPGVDEMAKQRYLEEEKERLRQYEEQRRRQLEQQGAPTSSGGPPPPSNPFGGPSTALPPTNAADLLFFDTPPNKGGQQQGMPPPNAQIEPSNPFAIVAEINNRSQPAAPPPGVNPFLGGAFGGAPPPPAMNPFGLGQSAVGPPNPYGGYGPPPSTNPYYGGTPQPHQQQYWPQNVPPQPAGGALGIYSQTPFSGTDGSYTAPSGLQQNMEPPQSTTTTAPPPQRPPPPHQSAATQPQQQFIAQWPQSTPTGPTMMTNGSGKNGGGNMDAALSNLVGNLAISSASSQPQSQYGQGGQWPAAMGGGGGSSNPFGAPNYAANNPF